MQKIISLFQRNHDTDRLVRDEIVPGAEWVVDGEGVATRKFDGTCCLVRNGKLFRRYEIKAGGKAPQDFEPASDVDGKTGKQQGWVPVGDGPQDKWHRQALDRVVHIADGTYELIGEKVQGNPEDVRGHWLVQHGEDVLADAPRDFYGIRQYLQERDIEGIVWHHPDGRMVKIKKKDFGLPRKP